MEACDRPVVVERLRSTYAIQDGAQPVGSPVHQEFRLDDLHRSQGCLPSGSDSSIQQVLERFVFDGREYQFKALCFGLSTAPQVFTRVMAPVSLFGRLASTSLIPSGGEGQVTANVQSVILCSKPRKIVVSFIPDDGLLGDGSGQPVFEGFSDSQADRNRPRANHRISVFQAAKRGLLARSLGSTDVVVPFGSGGLATSSRIQGFCR